MIPEAGQHLIDTIASYHPDFDKKYVERAVEFAVKYHGSQLRQSGEPYYLHPISVAQILADIKLDVTTIVTALLHDTVEDTDATTEMIKELFGGDVAYMVEGVTKLDKINFRSETEKQAENFRKFLMAISEDIRVLLVKLADRLHNMRTLHHISKDQKRQRISKETMDIYAPLAERIGLHTVKTELQNIAFKELHEDVYNSIITRLDYLREHSDNLVEKTVKSLEKILEVHDIKADISGREKMPFSIWMKMQSKKVGFENITDIIAFRIITKNVEDCYKVLGAVHTTFKSLPRHFDDYVSTPKANGYQSIHTIVMGEDNQKIEIQIRTQEMHEIAEYGVAAHWSYKQGLNYGVEGTQYKWIRQLLEIVENANDATEVLENTRLEMYHDHVFCFTPEGDLIVLPKDGTPVDFAFEVHTHLGRTCAGAKVNGRLVPLRTKLKNGDQVEIIQSKATNILESWEGFVKSGKARSEIRRHVRIKKQAEFVQLGKSIVKQIFLENSEDYDEEKLEPLLEKLKIANMTELFCDIGDSSISRNDLIIDLFPEAQLEKREKVDGFYDSKDERSPIVLKGHSSGSIDYASCCHPLPGERIVAIQKFGGATVHRANCPQLEQFVNSPEKWLDVKWDDTAVAGDNQGKFISRLAVMVENRKGALADIATTCATADANIYNVRIKNKGQDFCEITVDLELNNVMHLRKVMEALKNNEITSSVKRFKDKKIRESL